MGLQYKITHFFQAAVVLACIVLGVSGCQLTPAEVEDEAMVYDVEPLVSDEVIEVVMSLVPFTDVDDDHWAIDSIAAFYEEGIIRGFEDGTFRPDEAITEAQFIYHLAHYYNRFGEFELFFEQEEGDWTDEYYSGFADYHLELLGYEDEKLRHQFIERTLVTKVLSKLHNQEEELEKLIDSVTHFWEKNQSSDKDDLLTRAQLMMLLHAIEEQGLREIEDATLTNLREELDKLKKKEAELAAREVEEQAKKEEEKKNAEKNIVKSNEQVDEKQESTTKAKEPKKEEKSQETKQQQTKASNKSSGTTTSASESSSTTTSTNTSTTTSSSTPSDPVEKKTVIVTPSAIAMTDYLLPNKNSRPRTETTTHVMIHFISNAARKPQDPYNIKDVHGLFVEYGVSAHYMIGRDGQIYRLVHEDRVAYHAGKGNLPGFPQYKDRMNDYSIGIELLAVGTRAEMQSVMTGERYDAMDKSLIGYTEAQYESLNRLLNDIYDRNPSVKKNRKHVIGHDEYAPGRKSDPGSLFNWSKIGF